MSALYQLGLSIFSMFAWLKCGLLINGLMPDKVCYSCYTDYTTFQSTLKFCMGVFTRLIGKLEICRTAAGMPGNGYVMKT